MKFTKTELDNIKKLSDSLKVKDDEHPRKIWRTMEEISSMLSQAKQRNDIQAIQKYLVEYRKLYRTLDIIKTEIDNDVYMAERIIKEYSKF